MKKENIFIALGVAAATLMVYNSYQKKRSDVPVYYRKKLSGNYNARTIPPFGIYILDSERDNDNLLAHELVHWKQYQDYGLMSFYLRYFNELINFSYDSMPMEMEARYLENEYCRNNYTECVRSGQSVTVYNPNFRM